MTGRSYTMVPRSWLPSQESNLPQLCLTGSRVHLARLTGKLVEERRVELRAGCLQGIPVPRHFPRRSDLVSNQALCGFSAALSPDQLSERIGADAGNRTRTARVALSHSALELHPRGGQGPSRTATDYAGRLQRLGLANAQPARNLVAGGGFEPPVSWL